MLYYLFRFLDQFGIPGSHIWSYISFRALLALILFLNRQHHFKKVTCELQGVRNSATQVPGGRARQAKGIVGAKALRQEHAEKSDTRSHLPWKTE